MAGTGTFRIFVSSTFGDFRAERNALQRYVFPRLRELCASKGASFQEIDLRWGVSIEAGADQRTMKICLDEIKRCLVTTPKPSFIALLGDRYGWMPLPYEIPVGDFKVMAFEPDEQPVVDAWYEKDENAVAPVYVLQPREGERAPRNRDWGEDEKVLRPALARECLRLPLPAQERYLASATAQEIAEATTDPGRRDHMFVFLRQITIGGQALADALPADGSADEYVDMLGGRVQDTDAAARLRSLKASLQREFATCSYDVEWETRDAKLGKLPKDLDECRALLDDPAAKDTLCFDVWRALATTILDEIEVAAGKPTHTESMLHRDFARARTVDAKRREDVLPRIARYCKTGEDDRVLAIAGDAGSGKTTLLAHAFLDAWVAHGGPADEEDDDEEPAELDATVLVRFIGGATPGSSDVRSLLADLSGELGGGEAVPAEFHKLVGHFLELLRQAGEQKPVIIFLDALDQLSDAYAARSLSWLPAELPKGVRIVVSTRVTERHPQREGETRRAETLVALERKFPEPVVVPLLGMEPELAEPLLEDWLTQAGRRLQTAQQEHVLERFGRTKMPLHLRLAFEEARLWRSYEGIPKELGTSIEDLIRNNLFHRLDDPVSHDKMVVERALGYLTASRHGLAEQELIDVLSRDDELYERIHRKAKHELPATDDPARRLPVVFWSRLFFDLVPYLTWRAAEGIEVLDFYHRELYEVARSRYLDVDGRPATRHRPANRHRSLAAYFRHRADPDGDRTWNSYPRGLAELPYHLTEAAPDDDVVQTELFELLTDFRFIERKVEDVAVVRGEAPDGTDDSHGGVFELQEDYDRALELYPGQSGEPGLGPLIVTARDRDGDLTVFCPACAKESPIDRRRLGEVEPCPECGRKLRLNTFTITPAWT